MVELKLYTQHQACWNWEKFHHALDHSIFFPLGIFQIPTVYIKFFWYSPESGSVMQCQCLENYFIIMFTAVQTPIKVIYCFKSTSCPRSKTKYSSVWILWISHLLNLLMFFPKKTLIHLLCNKDFVSIKI